MKVGIWEGEELELLEEFNFRPYRFITAPTLYRAQI
jgi:hypothetical protein